MLSTLAFPRPEQRLLLRTGKEGLGLRFVLAKRNHINLRADFAWGNSSRATYISLGEAF